MPVTTLSLSSWVLLNHFLDRQVHEPDRIVDALCGAQGAEGLWPGLDLGGSVQVYFAMKSLGERSSQPHMARACAAIRDRGGAAHAAHATRLLLALFGELPWRAVAAAPVERLLLPGRKPVELAPLLVLASLEAHPLSGHPVGVQELFVESPRRGCDASGRRLLRRLVPGSLRRRAIDRVLAMLAPLEGLPSTTLGATAMMLDALRHPLAAAAETTLRRRVESLLSPAPAACSA
jgi:squalene-hopene/tetraprenyl-beta-curcumene cyclase